MNLGCTPCARESCASRRLVQTCCRRFHRVTKTYPIAFPCHPYQEARSLGFGIPHHGTWWHRHGVLYLSRLRQEGHHMLLENSTDHTLVHANNGLAQTYIGCFPGKTIHNDSFNSLAVCRVLPRGRSKIPFPSLPCSKFQILHLYIRNHHHLIRQTSRHTETTSTTRSNSVKVQGCVLT